MRKMFYIPSNLNWKLLASPKWLKKLQLDSRKQQWNPIQSWYRKYILLQNVLDCLLFQLATQVNLNWKLLVLDLLLFPRLLTSTAPPNLNWELLALLAACTPHISNWKKLIERLFVLAKQFKDICAVLQRNWFLKLFHRGDNYIPLPRCAFQRGQRGDSISWMCICTWHIATPCLVFWSVLLSSVLFLPWYEQLGFL